MSCQRSVLRTHETAVAPCSLSLHLHRLQHFIRRFRTEGEHQFTITGANGTRELTRTVRLSDGGGLTILELGL